MLIGLDALWIWPNGPFLFSITMKDINEWIVKGKKLIANVA